METTEKKEYAGVLIEIRTGDDLLNERPTTRDEADQYVEDLKTAIESEYPGADVRVEMMYATSGGGMIRCTSEPDAGAGEREIERRVAEIRDEVWINGSWMEEEPAMISLDALDAAREIQILDEISHGATVAAREAYEAYMINASGEYEDEDIAEATLSASEAAGNKAAQMACEAHGDDAEAYGFFDSKTLSFKCDEIAVRGKAIISRQEP